MAVAKVTLTVDTSELNRMSVTLARLMGQHEWITARAMTTAAKASKERIRAEVFPMIKGGPAAWTRRGLIASYASPKNLTSQVGFQYGEGSFNDSEFTRKAGGVPSGRYMGINAKGGDRRPKATELGLRRAGLIGNDQFITPPSKPSTAAGGVKLNAQGNLPGGEYQRILSRMRALPGGVGNAPQGAGSRGRSGKGRKETDYFMLRGTGGRPSRWQLGAEPMAVAKRAGRSPKGGTGKGSGRPGRPQTVGYRRGFVRALNVIDQPNYERRFPIQRIAMREYQRVFSQAYEAGVKAELMRRR
jgi:hypothetical protein